MGQLITDIEEEPLFNISYQLSHVRCLMDL
jgi:hypothetical protein